MSFSTSAAPPHGFLCLLRRFVFRDTDRVDKGKRCIYKTREALRSPGGLQAHAVLGPRRLTRAAALLRFKLRRPTVQGSPSFKQGGGVLSRWQRKSARCNGAQAWENGLRRALARLSLARLSLATMARRMTGKCQRPTGAPSRCQINKMVSTNALLQLCVSFCRGFQKHLFWENPLTAQAAKIKPIFSFPKSGRRTEWRVTHLKRCIFNLNLPLDGIDSRSLKIWE